MRTDDGRRSVAAASRAGELLDVGDVEAAALAGGFLPRSTQVFELGEAFDEGQREEEEHAEAAESGGEGDSGGCVSCNDAKWCRGWRGR